MWIYEHDNVDLLWKLSSERWNSATVKEPLDASLISDEVFLGNERSVSITFSLSLSQFRFIVTPDILNVSRYTANQQPVIIGGMGREDYNRKT